MIFCSDAFKSKIGGSVRYLKAYLIKDSGAAEIKSFVLKTGGMGAERFNFGTVYIPEASIITTEQIAVIKNEKIQIKLYVNDEKYDSIEGIENCVIADMYAYSCTKSGNLYTVSAHGYLYLNDPVISWGAEKDTATFAEIISKIQTLTGKPVTIKGAAFTDSQIQSILTDMTIKRITEQPTVKAYLAQMAETLMGYAYESVAGEFVICHGFPAEDTTGMESNVLSADVKEHFSISRLTCIVSEGYTDEDGNFIVPTSLFAEGVGNDAVKYRGYTTTEAQFNMLKTDILTVQYAPGTVTLFGNPLIEPLDGISFTDGNGDTQFIICAGEITQTYDGGLQTEIVVPENTSGADQQALDDEYTSAETDRQKELSYAKVKDLIATNVTVEKLYAETAKISDLNATNAAVKKLDAETVKTTELEASVARFGYITAASVEAQYARLDKANIGVGWIDSAMIGEGVVGTVQIADGSITDAKIVGMTANKITAGTIDAANIEVVNLNAANITVGTINGQQIGSGAITSGNLGGGAVTAGKIALDAVTAGNIAAGAVTADKLAAGAVTADKINAGAVTSDKIVSDAVTADKIAANAVTADKILAGAITSDKISTKAITADKLDVDDLHSISAKIGGWELGTGYIRDRDTSNRYTGMGRSGVAYAYFAGGTKADGSDGVFRVGHDGCLTATNAVISGNIVADSFKMTHGDYVIWTVEPGGDGFDVGMSGGLYVGIRNSEGSGSLSSGMRIAGGAIGTEVAGPLSISGKVTALTGIDIYGNVTIGGSLTMTGNITVNGGTAEIKGSSGAGYLWLGSEKAGWYQDPTDYGRLQCRYKTSESAGWSYTNVAAIMSTLGGKLPISNPGVSGTLTAPACVVSSSLTLNNGVPFYAKNSAGTSYGIFTVSASNNFHFGYGLYDNSYSNVYYSGNTVYVRAKTHLYRNLSWEATSDARLKHDIADIPDALLNAYMDFEPKHFIWNDNPGLGKQSGVIAQQVLAALINAGADDSNIVTQTEDTEAYGFPVYTVNYDAVNVLTMAVTQRQERRIKVLEEEVAKLKARLSGYAA